MQTQVAERLAQLAIDGHLTAEAVVSDAANPKSPLHSRFEWDNSKAAHEHRLEQARALIRSVRVEVQTERRVVSVVRYVRDPAAGKVQGYVETLRLRDEKALALEAIRNEARRVVAALERMQDVADVLGMNDEIEDIIKLVNNLKPKEEKAAAA